MEDASAGRATEWHHARGGHRPEGFSVLEMMMVVTLILFVVSITTPIFRTAVVRTREAVLADDLMEAVSSQPSAFSELAGSLSRDGRPWACAHGYSWCTASR